MKFSTAVDPAIINLIHARAKFFLWDQRHRRGNEGWFTVEQIADIFREHPPMISFIVALKDLAATGSIEGDDEGRLRHI